MNEPGWTSRLTWKFKAAIALVALGVLGLMSTAYYFANGTQASTSKSKLELQPLQPRTVFGQVGRIQRLTIPQASADAEFTRAEQAFENGWIGLAEMCFRRSLELNSDSVVYRLRLGRHLYFTGQVFAARQTWEPLLRNGGMNLSTMPLLGNDELKLESKTKSIQNGLIDSPDIATTLANVHLLLAEQDVTQANRLLFTMMPKRDSWTDQFKILRARYLEITDSNEELSNWLAGPESQPADVTPDYMTIKGRFHRNNGELARALQCFVTAFRLDPIHRSACSQLAEMLQRGNRPDAAAFYRQRAEWINEYKTTCAQIHRSNGSPQRTELESAIRVCSRLHLMREAVAWSRIAEELEPDSDWIKEVGKQCISEIKTTDGRYSRSDEFLHWLKDSETLFAPEPSP